eukprot:NODE_5365_length_665_cov_31.197026_g5202_i0.p1 GENE.NODE_5365_length_665_cov_31.197026_g5202_i0~~NODE_5365_length_665_cov_31.197026_g5202_i0.p1  ORF type:complete len:220 (+),score=55.44 NODE_5365_length_665_cov_31.197026_g5202_i0:45-662(+)
MPKATTASKCRSLSRQTPSTPKAHAGVPTQGCVVCSRQRVRQWSCGGCQRVWCSVCGSFVPKSIKGIRLKFCVDCFTQPIKRAAEAEAPPKWCVATMMGLTTVDVDAGSDSQAATLLRELLTELAQRGWGSFFRPKTAPASPTFSTLEAYTLLGVPPGASPAQLRQAYLKKCLLLHPDKNPPQRHEQCKQEFQRLAEMYALVCET